MPRTKRPGKPAVAGAASGLGHRPQRRWRRLALVVGMGMFVSLTALPSGAQAPAKPLQALQPVGAVVADGEVVAKGKAKPPNIVLVLIDDFSANLLKTMPHTRKLKRDGAYFPNSFVADSLCCTSRSVLLTGLYPHNNGVRLNTRGRPEGEGKPLGGWAAFKWYDNGKKTFANAINKRDGRRYRTAFQGKFLNGYRPKKGDRVPPGWTQWNAILGSGYREWDYKMTETRHRKDGRHVISNLRTYDKNYTQKPEAYVTNVLKRRAVRYIKDSRKNHEGRPYFLEIAPYGTHSRLPKKDGVPLSKEPLFPPAIGDRKHPKQDANHTGKDDHGNCGTVDCFDLKAKNLPGFNNPTKNNRPEFDNGRPARQWHHTKRLGPKATRKATSHLRSRARMAQSIDRMVGQIRKAAGPNTYIIVTSDNGFHLGQHRSKHGKATAYDYDIRVPLIVYKKAAKKENRLTPGPRKQVVSNVDLAPTIRHLSRTPLAKRHDGVSLVTALRNPKKESRLRYTFIEHTRPPGKKKFARLDPDNVNRAKGGTSGVPSYIAVRSRNALLVRYKVDRSSGNYAQPWQQDGFEYAWEFYRYHRGEKNGLVEKVNTYDKDNPRVKDMKAALRKFDGCKGAECRQAR